MSKHVEREGLDPGGSPLLRPMQHIEFAVTVLLLLMYIGWILSLPAWPSQDGPVHLYYTGVLAQLLRHTASPYRQYYFIKHLLPPYALYYYGLLLLSRVVSPLMADRLMICTYLATFVFGFRYLAKAFGQYAERATMLATLLLLNWALGMGFVNYCLSLALSFWALGFWLRLEARRTVQLRALFLGSVILVTLAHPVPLLFVLLFCGLDLLLRWPHGRQGNESSGGRLRWTADAITLAAASLMLIYVKAFTATHPLEQRTVSIGSPLHRALFQWLGFVQGKSLALLLGRQPSILLYRAALFILLVAAMFVTAKQWRRNRGQGIWTRGDTFFCLAVALLLLLPWLPSDLSGAYFFTERLTVLLWICALLATAAITPGPRHSTRDTLRASLLAAGTLLLTVTLLWQADQVLRPSARREAELAGTSLPVLRGKVVLVLEGAPSEGNARRGAAWNPNYWAAVGLVRGNTAVLGNAPWLDSPIIPLAPTAALAGAVLSPALANSPSALTAAMKADAGLRAELLRGADAVSFLPLPESGPGPEFGLVRGEAAVPGPFNCRTAPGGEYRVCVRSPTAP